MQELPNGGPFKIRVNCNQFSILHNRTSRVSTHKVKSREITEWPRCNWYTVHTFPKLPHFILCYRTPCLVFCYSNFNLLLLWRYNSETVLAFPTIAFHLERFCTCSAHFTSFIFFKWEENFYTDCNCWSFLTSSSHLDLDLPAGLPVNGFHFCILFTMLVSGILFVCPNQLNRWALTKFIMSRCLIHPIHYSFSISKYRWIP